MSFDGAGNMWEQYNGKQFHKNKVLKLSSFGPMHRDSTFVYQIAVMFSMLLIYSGYLTVFH